MPTCSLNKTYADGQILVEQDLDNIRVGVQDFLNTTKIDSTNIQAGGVTGSNIASNTITSANMASSSIVTAAITDANVTTAKIADANVTAAKLATALQTAFVPSGAILPYGGTAAPSGYLMCDGTSYLRADYPTLFTAIGTAFGAADGTHFNVPKLQGQFLRGVDNGVGLDPDASSRTAMATGGNTGDAVGSIQSDQFRSHTHQDTNSNNGTSGFGYQSVGDAGSTHSTGASGGNETRPTNVGVNYIIKT